MNKFLFYLIFLFAFVQNSRAQDTILEELKAQKCSFDSTANAMMILAKGEISFDHSGNTTIKYYYRIKIFKKEALNDWGNIKLDANRGEISHIDGTTYNLVNGQIVKNELEKESVFKGKLTKTIDINRVAMPNVREGSVIEYSFRRTINQYVMPSWIFQHSIPTLSSEYELKVPYNGIIWSGVKSEIRGPYKPTVYETKNKDKYQKWVMEKLPAFKAEPMMPHLGVYLSKIVFWSPSLLSNWTMINAGLSSSSHFGGVISNRPQILKEKVAKITAGVKDTINVIKKISQWVKDSLIWNGRYNSNFNEIAEILKNKNGSARDINFILGAMLAEVGLNVDMVLLSTHDNGFVMEEVSSTSQFDYVVCLVRLSKTKIMLLDATEKYLPYDILPERCLNYKGFIVSNNGSGWIDIKPLAKKAMTISEELNFSESLSQQGRLTVIASGYDGWHLRKAYIEEIDFKNSIFNLSADKNQNKTKTIYKNQNEIDKPFIIEQTLDEKTYGQIIGDKIYIDPFEDITQDKNPFVTDTREYPIEFAVPIDETIVVTITLPKNAVVEELPKSKGLTLPNNAARFLFQVSQANDKIIVTSKFQVNSSFILQEQYPKLRELYAQMLSKRDEMIVLTLKK